MKKRTRLHAERRANANDSDEHDQWDEASRCTTSLVCDREYHQH